MVRFIAVDQGSQSNRSKQAFLLMSINKKIKILAAVFVYFTYKLLEKILPK